MNNEILGAYEITVYHRKLKSTFVTLTSNIIWELGTILFFSIYTLEQCEAN